MPGVAKLALVNRIKADPAPTVGFVIALIGLSSSFGLHVTQGQSTGIVSLVGAVLDLLGAGVTRSQVTPSNRFVVAKHQDGVFLAGPAAGKPVGTPVQAVMVTADQTRNERFAAGCHQVPEIFARAGRCRCRPAASWSCLGCCGWW